jgi:Na+-translocating ferredoxin:NAD+ oxidoreductase subunit D
MRSGSTVTTVMGTVLLALVPGIVGYYYFFGPAILIQLAVSTLVALACEAAMLVVRRAPLRPYLIDLSAVLTAWLFSLSVPPLVPWWITAAGVAFAIVVAKHLYGGLGNNPFNPAMAGFCAMIVAFPKQMSQWPPPLDMAATRYTFEELVGYIFPQIRDAAVRYRLDAETMATPLDVVKAHIEVGQQMSDLASLPIFGHVGGADSEIVAALYLLGGLFMWWRGVVTWHMPVAFLAGMAIPAAVAQVVDPTHQAGILFHLCAGGSVLGAFFIVTDPVSGATTPRGKLVFAAAAGSLTWLIRVLGGYVDGVAFAVLVMNCCVPLIDAYTQPAVFGRRAAARDASR